MGKRGPQPKPTRLRVIEGRVPSKKKAAREPQPAPGPVACPRHVTGEARKFWNAYAPELHRMGLLTVLDIPLFEQLCEKWADWQEQKAAVKKHGRVQVTSTGYQQISGYATAEQKAEDAFLRRVAHFGMSPSSRAGLSVDKPAENPLEVMIRGAK